MDRDELDYAMQTSAYEDICAALTRRFPTKTKPMADGRVRMIIYMPAPPKSPKDGATRRRRRPPRSRMEIPPECMV